MVARRIRFAFLLLACALAPARGPLADDAKVLRLALPDIAYLDPQQITDLYSTRVANVIFEGLYQFDYLADAGARRAEHGRGDARDHRRRPHLDDPDQARASGSPTTPAFKGKPRELVAAGLRLFDQARARSQSASAAAIRRSPTSSSARGRSSTRRRSPASSTTTRRSRACSAIDRHTLRLKLTGGRLHGAGAARASSARYAVAREAVEAAGDDVVTQAGGHRPVPPRASGCAARASCSRPIRDYRPHRVSRQRRSGAAADGRRR